MLFLSSSGAVAHDVAVAVVVVVAIVAAVVVAVAIVAAAVGAYRRRRFRRGSHGRAVPVLPSCPFENFNIIYCSPLVLQERRLLMPTPSSPSPQVVAWPSSKLLLGPLQYLLYIICNGPSPAKKLMKSPLVTIMIIVSTGYFAAGSSLSYIAKSPMVTKGI